LDLDLDGKVAVVTGAGKGIGLAAAMALAREGAYVVAGSRSAGGLDGLDGITPVAIDLSAADGPAQLIRRAIEEHGQIDVLVNNVGAVRMRTKGFLGTSDEDFAWAMQMNFFIALRARRAALTAMAERGTGAIVNVASVNAFFQPDAATIDYGAAKAALVNLTKTLAQEFGPRGIRVNAVSPGPVATDLWLGEHGVAETVAKLYALLEGPRPARHGREVRIGAGALGTRQGRGPRGPAVRLEGKFSGGLTRRSSSGTRPETRSRACCDRST
jgi:NAD(P)-dependent dehydrogenase (short-subunit alcohol dehydrogenase family)